MSATNDLIKEIKEGLTQKSASAKDELRVMQCMLNDKEYKVDVYSGTGEVTQFCPSEEARSIIASVITSSVKLSKDEAVSIADNHEFSKNEANSFIGISKEFINTYLATDRKLPLGGREESNISLMTKVVPAKASKTPKKTGVGENGEAIYESVFTGKTIPEHRTIRVSGSCPKWVK